MKLIVVCLLLILAAAPAAASHDKIDVATTNDGVTYIGEIKSVEFATLNLKTNAAGLLHIEWRYVSGLTSNFEYRVEVSGGVRYFGTLGPPGKPGNLSIVGSSGAVEVDLVDVVKIVPIEQGFWNRVDGSVNFGLTYTQANEAFQYNLNGDTFYRSRKNYAKLTYQSIFNTQEAGETTKQHYVRFYLSQIGRTKWGPFQLGELASNPNQGYDLRFIVGGGATNTFIASARKMFFLNLGVVYNREYVTGGSEVDQTAEALVGASFRRFKLGSHAPSTQLTLNTFTGLNNNSRFRSVLNFNISWKIIGNFQFSFQVNDSYDSNPPGGEESNKNDLSLVNSIGYTF